MEADMVDMGVLVGSIRRIGLEGPPYEVLGPAATSLNGKTCMMIRLLESGEEVDYGLDAILADPSED
jgi:Family of unknown function (DUF5397)